MRRREDVVVWTEARGEAAAARAEAARLIDAHIKKRNAH